MPATKTKTNPTPAPEVEVETGIQSEIETIYTLDTTHKLKTSEAYLRLAAFVVVGKSKDLHPISYYKEFVEEKFKERYAKDPSNAVEPNKNAIQRILKIATWAKLADVDQWTKEKLSIDTVYGMATAKPRSPISAKEAPKPDGWVNPDLGTPAEVEKQNKDLEDTNTAAKGAIKDAMKKVAQPLPEDLQPTKKGEKFDHAKAFAHIVSKNPHIFRDLIDELINSEDLTPDLIVYAVNTSLQRIGNKHVFHILESLMNNPLFRGYAEDYINDDPSKFDRIDPTQLPLYSPTEIEPEPQPQPQPEESNAESNQA